MEEWSQILVAFVNDDQSYDFGTTAIEDFKVATPDRKVKVQRDPEWEDLLSKGKVFAGGA